MSHWLRGHVKSSLPILNITEEFCSIDWLLLVSYLERDVSTSNYNYRFVFFLSSIKSTFKFCFMYFEEMLIITYTFGMVSSNSQPFLLLSNAPQSLIITLVLMSTFSDIYIATQTLWLEGVQYIFFKLLAFNLSMHFYMYVSYKKYSCVLFFPICLENLSARWFDNLSYYEPPYANRWSICP